MSHFVGFAFGNYENKLDKYCEYNDVEPYIKYTKSQAIELGKEYISKLLDNSKLENNLDLVEKYSKYTDEDFYNYVAERYNNIDEDGNIYTTYNPNSKYDWYDEGGRWCGFLPLKNGEYSTQAYIFEVDLDKLRIPYCFITIDGEWNEVGQMGWFGISYNEKDENIWKNEVLEYIKSLEDNTLITVIDFHI